MPMGLLHCLHGLHAPGIVGSALAAVAIACSLPHGLQETNQEVPEFLSQAAAMAGPYVPPVRIGGGGSTYVGSFGKSFGSRGACLSTSSCDVRICLPVNFSIMASRCEELPEYIAASVYKKESCSALETQSTRCSIPRSQTSIA